MASSPSAEPPFDPIADVLGVLGSAPRLRILHALRTPRTLGDLVVPARRTRRGEREGRPMARQSVRHHLDALIQAGLVEPVKMGRAEGYVMSHTRMFAMADEVQGLARLRPVVRTATTGATMERDAADDAGLPDPPRLMLARGREERAAWGLGPAAGRTWRIGRGHACEVRLDWDPYASTVNAIVEGSRDGFRIRDAGSRNGTWVDWMRVAHGRAVGLRPGALVAVGRSLLVFQA